MYSMFRIQYAAYEFHELFARYCARFVDDCVASRGKRHAVYGRAGGAAWEPACLKTPPAISRHECEIAIAAKEQSTELAEIDIAVDSMDHTT